MHWNDIEQIVEELEDNYPDEEVPNLGYLKEMVLSLANFEDLEEDADDEVLKKIREGWLEIRNEL